MKLTIAAIGLLILCTSGFGQAVPAKATRVAIINSEAFGDEKTGITKLVNAVKALQGEFKVTSAELDALRAQGERLAADLEQTQAKINSGVADAGAMKKELDQKQEQLQNLQIDLRRKQEDAKSRFDKRGQQLTEPVFKEIGAFLDSFATRNSIDLILDPSKTAGVIMFGSSLDMTTAFIKEFNSKSAGVPVR
jgi:Skp family chaperone for outer membrane proteins